jgi:hypothetical protein
MGPGESSDDVAKSRHYTLIVLPTKDVSDFRLTKFFTSNRTSTDVNRSDSFGQGAY